MTMTAPVKQGVRMPESTPLLTPVKMKIFIFNRRDIENNTWAHVDIGFLFERLTQ